MRAVFKRIVIICLILAVTAGNSLYSRKTIAAVPAGIALKILGYSSDVLTVGWDTVPGAKSVRVTSGNPEVSIGQPGLNEVLISGLKNDVIYDIKVEFFDGADCSGSKIGVGLIYFLPRITFKSKIIDQSYEDLIGGGRESGSNPRLNLSWKMPVYWTGMGYSYINDAIAKIQQELCNIYGVSTQVAGISYRINISNDFKTLDGDSSIASINIEFTTSGYKASVAGSSLEPADVRFDPGTGYMSLDVKGRKDEQSALPAEEEYAVSHPDIFPGSVYYMNIKPVFKDVDGTLRSILRVGPPDARNGSLLYGNVPYTYTPIRFKLSKDASDNVYVRIYRINQGSLDLPRLYYEIQVSDDPTITGDWTVKKTMDDSYFIPGVGYADSVISGISSTNEIYYKIVVKSDAINDRIESLGVPYTLSEDINRPPVPKGIQVVGRSVQTREVDDNGEMRIEKTTNVTISWEKPDDWENIKANTDPSQRIYYHIMLNTNQSDINTEPYPELTAEGKSYGNFPAVYRLVKYFDVLSPNVVENGDRLEYTIKGFELFSGEDADGISDDTIPNPSSYPDWLLPNKVYYIQMYTTKGIENKGSTNPEYMSDRSIAVSFTTFGSAEREVPLPKDFRVGRNDIEITTDPQATACNYIELMFDKVNINWSDYTTVDSSKCKIYYDLFMSTRPDPTSFIKIGSTQMPGFDVEFVGLDDQGTSIKAVVKNFTVQSVRNRFGDRLRPNTTYYFVLKTRLSIEGQPEDRVSDFTPVLPVTTVRSEIQKPDESARKPLAPVDFTIARNDKDMPMVTGTSATFKWLKKEDNVVYNIIFTSSRVESEADLSTYANDGVYQSFRTAFGDYITVDLSQDSPQDNLQYNNQDKSCMYTVNKWLFPNRLYYASIRAVNRDTGSASTWVSIPVTTSLIEAPLSIEIVNDYELNFQWDDSTNGMSVNDYSVYIKGPGDSNYKPVERKYYSLIKDDSTYYCRIMNLLPGTSYDIKVYKGRGVQGLAVAPVVVYEKTNMTTRDGFHEIEVNWKGVEGYGYEIAIKEESAVDYITLSEADLQHYTTNNGQILPYYVEKKDQNGNDLYSYYAVIKSIPVKLPDGTVEHRPLESNTRYYIKVRSFKADLSGGSATAYSKYIGPVETRTEFSQKDYDKKEEEERRKNVFLERISRLERELYWKVAMDDVSTNRVLLKGDRVINALENSKDNSLLIDISGIKKNSSTDVVYIPSSVIQAINNQNISLAIRMAGVEFVIRPGTFNIRNNSSNTAQPAYTYYKLTITRNNKAYGNVPKDMKPVSKVVGFYMQGIESLKTDDQFERELEDALYNQDSGIVEKKMNQLIGAYGVSQNGLSASIDDYMDELVNEVENELSDYIAGNFDVSGITSDMITKITDIKKMDSSAGGAIALTENTGIVMPYMMAPGNNTWKKISESTGTSFNMAAFNIHETGEYAIFSLQSSFLDVPYEYGVRNDIQKLFNMIDLKSVFGDGSYLYPESNTTVREMILLYEKASERNDTAYITDMKQKARVLGLEKITGTGNMYRDISRQETAAALAQLYAYRLGVSVENLKPGAYIPVKDEKSIYEGFFKSVEICLDAGIMDISEDGRFIPYGPVTRMEMLSYLARILDLTR